MTNEKWLINAWDLIEWLDNFDRENTLRILRGKKAKLLNSHAIRNMIVTVPRVDAVEVVHGRWEPHPRHPGFDRCSICHNCIVADDWADGVKWRFCPQCGANMDL